MNININTYKYLVFLAICINTLIGYGQNLTWPVENKGARTDWINGVYLEPHGNNVIHSAVDIDGHSLHLDIFAAEDGRTWGAQSNTPGLFTIKMKHQIGADVNWRRRTRYLHNKQNTGWANKQM